MEIRAESRSAVQESLLGDAWPTSVDASAVRVSVIEDARSLRELRAEWDALHDACPRPSLCARHAWVVAWWDAFGGDELGAGRDTALFVVVVRDGGGRLVGALPLFEERVPRGSFRVRRLRNVGFLGREGVYDMTEEPTVLIRPEWEAQVLKALARTVREGLRQGRWDLVFLRYLDDEAATPLDRAFESLRPAFKVKTDRKTGPLFAALPETWAEYRKRLTKSMRDNLGYYPRLLTRHGHDWSVRYVREPCEIRAAAGRLATLHQARACQSTGVRHNDHIHGLAQEVFLTELLERLSAEGRAFIAELIVGGEVVASQAFVESGEELMVYYSGYREAWYRYSPVFVIDAVVFKEAQAHGVRRLNFLRAPAEWKARWGAVDGPTMHRVFVVPWHPLSWLRLAAYLTRVVVQRDIVQKIPEILEEAAIARMKRKAKGSRPRSVE